MEEKFINDFIGKFKEALNAENKEINLNDKFRDYDEWDSLRYLSVISMLDSEFDVIIEPKEFQKIETIKELINEVYKKLK